MNLYCTTDLIGLQSGGGLVTYQESQALREFEKTDVHLLDFKKLGNDHIESDNKALKLIAGKKYKIAHFYSGSFPRTVKELIKNGTFVTYTIAAHNIELSKGEFESYGLPYNFPHLIDPELFKQYTEGHRSASLVICPSQASASYVKTLGYSRVKVIPHGVNIPVKVPKLPENFNVGYLGQVGPDKGLRYLYVAWKLAKLNNSRLIMAGKNGITMLNLQMVRMYSGGNMEMTGYVEHLSDFFSKISVYVQPSVTEGFGIEVLEAMAYGRPVIVSDGCGAADVVGDAGFVVPKRNPEVISEKIKWFHSHPEKLAEMSEIAVKKASEYSWDKIRKQYRATWEKHTAPVTQAKGSK